MCSPLARPCFAPQEKEHDSFKRINIDLIYEKKITLTEALCGCDFTIKQLDGRVLRVRAGATALPSVTAFASVRQRRYPGRAD